MSDASPPADNDGDQPAQSEAPAEPAERQSEAGSAAGTQELRASDDAERESRQKGGEDEPEAKTSGERNSQQNPDDEAIASKRGSQQDDPEEGQKARPSGEARSATEARSTVDAADGEQRLTEGEEGENGGERDKKESVNMSQKTSAIGEGEGNETEPGAEKTQEGEEGEKVEGAVEEDLTRDSKGEVQHEEGESPRKGSQDTIDGGRETAGDNEDEGGEPGDRPTEETGEPAIDIQQADADESKTLDQTSADVEQPSNWLEEARENLLKKRVSELQTLSLSDTIDVSDTLHKHQRNMTRKRRMQQRKRESDLLAMRHSDPPLTEEGYDTDVTLEGTTRSSIFGHLKQPIVPRPKAAPKPTEVAVDPSKMLTVEGSGSRKLSEGGTPDKRKMKVHISTEVTTDADAAKQASAHRSAVDTHLATEKALFPGVMGAESKFSGDHFIVESAQGLNQPKSSSTLHTRTASEAAAAHRSSVQIVDLKHMNRAQLVDILHEERHREAKLTGQLNRMITNSRDIIEKYLSRADAAGGTKHDEDETVMALKRKRYKELNDRWVTNWNIYKKQEQMHQDEIDDLSSILQTKKSQLEIANEYTTKLRRKALRISRDFTGYQLSEMEIDALLAKIDAQEQVLNEARVANLKLVNSLQRLNEKLREMENLGDGVNLIDFEQLKLKNEAANLKIEERNEEVNRLKVRTTHTVQLITHLNMKRFKYEQDIQKIDQIVENIDEVNIKKRQQLRLMKANRDQLHKENEWKRAQCELLFNKTLMRDWAESEERYKALKKEEEELQRRNFEALTIRNAKVLTAKLNKAERDKFEEEERQRLKPKARITVSTIKTGTSRNSEPKRRIIARGNIFASPTK